MSHPEQPSGGGSTGAIAEPSTMNGTSGGSLAEFAAQHGLTKSAARPPLKKYLSDTWDRRNFIWAFASAKNISLYTDSRLGQVWQVLTPPLNARACYLLFRVPLHPRPLRAGVRVPSLSCTPGVLLGLAPPPF